MYLPVIMHEDKFQPKISPSFYSLGYHLDCGFKTFPVLLRNRNVIVKWDSLHVFLITDDLYGHLSVMTEPLAYHNAIKTSFSDRTHVNIQNWIDLVPIRMSDEWGACVWYPAKGTNSYHSHVYYIRHSVWIYACLLIASSSLGSFSMDEWQWVWCDGSCVVIIRDNFNILAGFMASVGSNWKE